MDPVDHRPRPRDTTHLHAFGLEWEAVDDPNHGSGAYAHPPVTRGCAAAFADGFWYSLYPGGRRVEGQAADENAAREAAIEALKR